MVMLGVDIDESHHNFPEAQQTFCTSCTVVTYSDLRTTYAFRMSAVGVKRFMRR